MPALLSSIFFFIVARALCARVPHFLGARIFLYRGRPPFLRLPVHHASGFSYLVTTYVATWLATVLLDGVGNLTVSLLLTVKPCSLPILITGPLFQRPSRRLQGGLVSPYAKGNRVGDTANAGWVGEN